MKVREVRKVRGVFELLLTARAAGFVLLDRPPFYECAPWADEGLVEQLDAEPLVPAILAGVRTGHRWAPCDRCGEVVIVKAGTKPMCRLTPRCPGHHVPVALPRGSVR